MYNRRPLPLDAQHRDALALVDELRARLAYTTDPARMAGLEVRLKEAETDVIKLESYLQLADQGVAA